MKKCLSRWIINIYALLLVTNNYFTCAVELECNYRNFQWTVSETVYGCEIRTVLDVNNSELTAVNGSHWNEKKNTDVKALWLWNRNATSTIPSGIGKIFPNIRGLWWYKGGLEIITAEDLKQFPKLEELALYKNRLVALEGDLFKHVSNLKFISFEDNSITNIDANILDQMDQLEEAVFYGNDCIDYKANNRTEIELLKRLIATKCS